jgi:hypothetical protein
VGVGGLGGVVFGVVELRFQAGLVLAEFGAALVEVADEVLVRVVDEFEVAGQPPAAVVGVGDGPAQGGDALGVLVGGGVGLLAQVGGEQAVTVVAEDVVGEELVQGVQEGVFTDPGRSTGRPPGPGRAAPAAGYRPDPGSAGRRPPGSPATR